MTFPPLKVLATTEFTILIKFSFFYNYFNKFNIIYSGIINTALYFKIQKYGKL